MEGLRRFQYTPPHRISYISILILFRYIYGCKTWSHTLREERRLRVCENRVLRGVFGVKRDDVAGE
jgi:hypothetical protein